MNKRQHIDTLQSMYGFTKDIFDEYQDVLFVSLDYRLAVIMVGLKENI